MTEVQALLAELNVRHFPLLFPEILGHRGGGFNCLIGNPPWEKVKLDDRHFWHRFDPGILGASQTDRTRRIKELETRFPELVDELETEKERVHRYGTALTTGPFDGIGAGDPELHSAFAWRFWDLLGPDGILGVVLPRQALQTASCAQWRRRLLETGDFVEVVQLLNNRRWIFDDVHPQYTIALVTVRNTGTPDDVVVVRGPYSSLTDYRTGLESEPGVISATDLMEWTREASFPLVPSQEALRTFERLRRSPDLNESIPLRLISEFHANADRRAGFFSVDFEAEPKDSWSALKGASFNIWNPETGQRIGWAEETLARKELERRRRKGSTNRSSAFSEMASEWLEDPNSLPCLNPRIAFRGIARATDSRTMIAALVPPRVVLTNGCPYFLLREPSPRTEAFLLGVLSSVSLDWFARRIIEINVSFYLLEAFPIPRPRFGSDKTDRVVEIAGRLSAVDDRYTSWANQVGVPVGSVKTESEKSELIAELDAVVAHLYGLDVADLETIWDTFHTTVDHLPDLEKVVGYFEEWSR